jgi:hypothetical protein
MNNQEIIFLIICALFVITLFWVYKDSNSKKEKQTEGFDVDMTTSLDDYYNGASTDGVKQYLVDTMVCHPSCCGQQWPVPFDGLTPQEIVQCVNDGKKSSTEYIRTQYRCALGPNGEGCPCINKDAYRFLVNRGNNRNSLGSDEIEPTFMIPVDKPPVNKGELYYTPLQQIDSTKSVYTDVPLTNDTRSGKGVYFNLNGLQSSGTQMPGQVQDSSALSAQLAQATGVLSKTAQLNSMN